MEDNILLLNVCYSVFRWFKFVLKPPYSVANENLFLAIWDTSHWIFFVKFGLKTAWDISYDIFWQLLTYVNFWKLQGHSSIFGKIGCLHKINFFSMKEWQGSDKAWRVLGGQVPRLYGSTILGGRGVTHLGGSAGHWKERFCFWHICDSLKGTWHSLISSRISP